MAIPLIWLGVTAAAVYAGNKLVEAEVRQRGNVAILPGDCDRAVTPVFGSVVCCGIFEVFQHTGVWTEAGIVELKGNGLVRGVSPSRFLADRSGDVIYVACDRNYQPLASADAGERAVDNLFQYSEYDVIKNNCHRFVWHMVCGDDQPLTRFADLNQQLSNYYDSPIFWQPAATPTIT